jgi:dipeptidyl-peptidase-4
MKSWIEKFGLGAAAVLACLVGTLTRPCHGQSANSRVDVPQIAQQRSERTRRVYRDRVKPNWFANSTKFWYRNDLAEGAKEFVLVDAMSGVREPAFDHQAVANAIGRGTDARRLPINDISYSEDRQTVFLRGETNWAWKHASLELKEIESFPSNGQGLPNPAASNASKTGADTEITFVNKTSNTIELFWLSGDGRRVSYGKIAAGGSRDQHTFGGHSWLVTNHLGESLGLYDATDQPTTIPIDGSKSVMPTNSNRRNRRRNESAVSGTSPDGKWQAIVQDFNVILKSTDVRSPSAIIELSHDGDERNAYADLAWSPDSKTLIAFRVEPGEIEDVYLVQSSPEDGGRAKLQTRPYALPGDKFPKCELNLFQIDTREQLKPKVDRFEHERSRPRLRWNSDGTRFSYEQTDRGHQRFRLIEVQKGDGAVRELVDERSSTFIWTAHTDNVEPITWLTATNELLYVSERSGWRHVYLVDAEEGDIQHPVTSGDWVFRGVEQIDEPKRQLWFRASGCFPGQDPYLIHYGRVNLDGTGLVWLTEGHGNHSLQYAPDKNYLIDTYSRVDLAPVSELRRVSDGSLVCVLEQADTAGLVESGWHAPDVLHAKGRDGATDIWGMVCLPSNFDPSQKYPVIEDIYAGPHGSHVPKSFSPNRRYESLTELGFIVVKIDGMGTANRSKAFHDVCWQNIKDAGFEDRKLWIMAASQKYPQMDLTRVGIYGTSAGGQNAAAAVLFHSDFYKVAVAACGCHDNRMDKASWNEQWMGYPVGPHYSTSSNIDQANQLGGKLLLIVGEMDTNVPPESTMRFANALIQSNKDFDLLVVPNAGHGMGGSYGQRRMHDFFVRHLLR